MKRFQIANTIAGAVVALLSVVMHAQTVRPAASPISEILGALPFRHIGPFRPSAWITAVAVPDAPLHEHLNTIWAGSRSGRKSESVAEWARYYRK